MRTRLGRSLSLLGLWLALLGSADCEDPDEPPPDCDMRIGADAKRSWTIHADGRRRDCEDRELNGDLDIDLSAFLVDGKPVATTGNTAGGDMLHEADAFVERIRRAQYTLEAGPDAPGGLSFSGSVNTCQVSFRLRELLPRGQFHEYEFDGFVESAYRIYGEFEGVGPGSCRSEGKFEVEIR
jgi:hypothetical protein